MTRWYEAANGASGSRPLQRAMSSSRNTPGFLPGRVTIWLIIRKKRRFSRVWGAGGFAC
jgi:hypothetical protein